MFYLKFYCSSYIYQHLSSELFHQINLNILVGSYISYVHKTIAQL